MIISPDDLKHSIETPIIVPGVGKEPVWSSIFHTPTHDPDSMSSKFIPLNVLVNSRLVVDKVSVDGEGGLGGAVGHQLEHDLLLSVADGVGLAAEGLVLIEGHAVAGVLALLVASGGFGVGIAWAPAR